MTVKLLILYCLLFVVSHTEDVHAVVPFQDACSAYSVLPWTENLPVDDTPGNTVGEDKERSWTISVPVWIPGYRGQFTVGGIEVGGEPEDDSFYNRLFSSKLGLDFYFVGMVNYNWQSWDFNADIFSGTIGKSTIFTLNDKTVVDASLDMLIPRFFAAYDLLYNSSPLGPITNWKVYLGGRLFSVNIETIWPKDLGKKEESTLWFIFIFGTDITFKIIERLKLTLSGDIGGFASSTAPNLYGSAVVHYRPWDLFSASLGYAAIHIDRISEGSEKSSELKFRADLAGPVVTIAFHF